ncbi:dTDP-4-dehydrorhamnose reductase [Maribacter vaceletii]|uniref:dTDP-4-dehydrorhamnose reductase n=1 Tax=Maribacter vaceletii TaxID=1206816 RepID=A0A495ED17_9FLAO|nr:dTDP-4-dehydrorhamnose reductase [Maribacter vaceletii]RKR14778.1 dTDP-4-dehydrorhamnose reductase [Maribacter vaceletii]
MKRILVTGANGQLGKSIQEISRNYPNINFDFKSSKELDITNLIDLKILFHTNTYDYCINCAAYTNVKQAEKTPEIAYKVNTEGVKNLAESCQKNHTILVHLSTDYVFDGEKEEPYTVNDVPNPINAYGKSKWEGEKYIQKILKEYFIIRTSWLYSKKFGKNFYKTILEKAQKGEILKVTNEQIGCPTNTLNLSLFIIEKIVLNKNSIYGTFHFTDKLPMTWYEFAKLILEENNMEKSIKIIKSKDISLNLKRPKNSVIQ